MSHPCNQPNILEVTQLYFDYYDKPLLQNVSFSLTEGALLHLQGANGSGKTTLLKLLAGLLSPTAGEVRYLDDRRSLCYLGHKMGVNQQLTPREHWHFDLSTQASCSFDEAIDTLVLHGVEDTPCELLSAGLKRRVSLLRLVASDASLWLLDEPWVALDAVSMARLQELLTQHIQKGKSIILTSHQPLPFERNTYSVYCL